MYQQTADSVFWCEMGGFAVFGDVEFNHLLAVGTGFHVPGWGFFRVLKG